MKKSKTKAEYEEYLNGIDVPNDSWWMHGKHRQRDFWGRYGSALRKHDPIAFQVGYNEWKQKNN